MRNLKYIFQKKSSLWLLFIFTIFAFFLRFLAQPEVPYGFHRDEAGIAYSAYSIFQTGRDEWGRRLPLQFKALGDYPPGIYNYLVVLTIPFFGLSEMAERFPAIFLGTLMVPLSHLFVNRFFKNKRWAILTAIFVTFSPWMIVQSRAGSEALTAIFFTLLGFLSFQNWLKEKRWRYAFLLSFFYFLALYSYNAARVALPLLHLNLLFFFWKELSKREKKQQLLFTLVLFLFSLFSIFSSSAQMMSFENTSIFTQDQSEASLQVIFNREGLNGFPVVLSRIFTNKFSNLVLDFLRHYLDYFNPSFLFNDAGFHKRYMVPGVGPVLLASLPMILLGMFRARISTKKKRFLLFWLFIAPLAGAVTSIYVPNIKRAMYMFFPLLIFLAVGFEFCLKQSKKKWQLLLLLLWVGFYFWNFSYFLKQYFIHSKYETTQHRSYGYKELFASSKEFEQAFSRVEVYEATDTPHIFYLFYNKYSPNKYQSIPVSEKRDLFVKEKPVVHIENYEFHPEECPDLEKLSKDSLYVFKYGCLNQKTLQTQLKPIKIIFSPDNMPLFAITQF